MNICQNCNTENDYNSKFCKNCGAEFSSVTKENDIETKTNTDTAEIENPLPKRAKISISRKTKRVILILSVFIILLVVAFFSWKCLFGDIVCNKILEDYRTDKITHQEAWDKLYNIGMTGVTTAGHIRDCNELELSKESYKKGIEFKNKKDYINAIVELKKVIEGDPNYNDSKNEITELKGIAKDELLIKLEEYISKNNYTDALKMIDVSKNVFPDDKQIATYELKFKEIKEQEELKKKIESCDLSNVNGIEEYLNLKYNTLKDTPLGHWTFNIDVRENNSADFLKYDYSIYVEIISGQYSALCYSPKYSKSDRLKTDALLKSHMETLAKDIINRVPNKKFYGVYKIGTAGKGADYHYFWTNYEDEYLADYYDIQPSYFRWDSHPVEFYK